MCNILHLIDEKFSEEIKSTRISAERKIQVLKKTLEPFKKEDYIINCSDFEKTRNIEMQASIDTRSEIVSILDKIVAFSKH